MRVCYEFESDKPVKLPIQYNHILQGLIYDHISDAALKHFLHEEGFDINNRRYKMFTFSRLEGAFNMDRDKGVIEFRPPLKLTLSSAMEVFIENLSEAFMKSDRLNLAGQSISLSSIKVIPPPHIDGRVKIKMLSPVVAYSTAKNTERTITYYYSPVEENFSKIIEQGLHRKYQLIYNRRLPEPKLTIKPIGHIDDRYMKVIEYKGTVVKGWMGIYWLDGSPELIKVAYDSGIGSKTSMGFGCFDIIQTERGGERNA